MKSKFLLALGLICMLGFVTPAFATADTSSVPPIEAEADGARADYKFETKWVYKVEDGLLYRRLYCVNTGEWLTDWILVE